jgi:hypothetical protein
MTLNESIVPQVREVGNGPQFSPDVEYLYAD